mmetsp:Transcript_65895/g.148704  ORF Transcript_65895/g.148704 Transcript_65895/m.148704 type:complete len:194 (-) Transcript_65895:42-623(-)
MSKPIAPQAEPGDATVYVQLDEEGQPIEEIYVLQNETKKKSICGSICCVAVAAFLLCFFLIPRQPSVWLVHLNVGQASSGVAESAVTQITGTFKFRNENFFAVDWRAPAVSLYWLPYDDQPVVAGCWGEEPCSFWQDGWCAIKLGEFTDPGLKFSTGMRDGRQQVLELQQTAQQVCYWGGSKRRPTEPPENRE